MAVQETGERTRSFAAIVAAVTGVFFIVAGVWAFVAPEKFYETVATFEPYNVHFIRDIGAFQIGLGAVLLLSLKVGDALTVALGGVGIGALVHALAHIVDRDLGGSPATDIPFFSLMTVALLATAAARYRDARVR